MDCKAAEDGNKEALETGSMKRQWGSGWKRDDLERAEIRLDVGKEQLDKVGILEE